MDSSNHWTPLGSSLTTQYSLGVLVWNFYQTFETVSIEFWVRFEQHIRPTRLTITVLLITARVEWKVRLCVKLFDFLRGWILIRWTWNLSRLVPNSVEILTWNFRKKLFLENFSEILCIPRLSFTETCEISPYFLQFLFWIHIALKKLTQVLSYVVCTQVRRHVHKKITKRRYAEDKPGRSVFEKPVLFSLGLSYYALLLGSFGLKFLPDVHHCVYWVLAEIWAPNSFHEICNKFSSHHCQGWKKG